MRNRFQESWARGFWAGAFSALLVCCLSIFAVLCLWWPAVEAAMRKAAGL